MKTKVKICFIHPDLGIGGAERLVLDVASTLDKQYYDIKFITNHFDKSHAFQELKSGDYPVQVLGDWIPRSVFGKCQALCAYIRMIYLTIVYLLFFKKKDQPSLFFIDLIPIAIPILKLVNCKIVYYCHHPDLLASIPGGKLKQLYRKPIDWLELKATKSADVILVNSEYTASVFRSTFPEITKPIEIVYPSIAYSFQEAVKTLGAPKRISDLIPEINSTQNNLTIFLSLNRFHPAKILDLAIEAMEKLRERCSRSEWEKVLFIVAGGYDPQSIINYNYYTELVQLTNEKYLDEKIIFLKSPSDDLKIELLHSCSCLVYTPIKEHFGIVPLEAMSVGKPVIACNSGGPRETVIHEKTGFLCEPNADSMADFMYRILKEDNKKMGNEGKKNLENKFSYSSFKKRVNVVIKQALEN